MMPDERFDEVIRAALEWQADQDARRAPSLEKSVRVVAQRVAPERGGTAPLITVRSGPERGVRLVLAVVLLAALLAAALTIGSQLIRVQPDPLGLASECAASLRAGVVMQVQGPERSATLYADGLFVIDLSEAGDTQASRVDGARVAERHLTAVGRDVILKRVSEAGLTPGCRSWRTVDASGSITAQMPDGVVRINWGPGTGEFSFARVATIEEEARVQELAIALERPDTWLPSDAWLDAAEREVVPDQWVVIIGFSDTELPPGSRMGLPGGLELDGTDPRYERLVVPGGGLADAFGARFASPFSPAPRSFVRCGVVGRDEALDLAESIDALDPNPDGGNPLHNDDLTAEVSFDFDPAIREDYDCEAAMARYAGVVAPTAAPGPAASPGEFADVDPCRLASDEVMDLVGASRQAEEPSGLPIGVPASSCRLAGDVSPGARLTLYPSPVDAAAARALAHEVFGDGVVEVTIDGHVIWLNKCMAESLQCAGAVAGVSGPYLVLIDFDGGWGTTHGDAEKAQSVLVAALNALPD